MRTCETCQNSLVCHDVGECLAPKMFWTVVAFRYGGNENVFPIGVFDSLEEAETAAKEHALYRGGKYSHRIYLFKLNEWDDDVGHKVNSRSCIEDENKSPLTLEYWPENNQ